MDIPKGYRDPLENVNAIVYIANKSEYRFSRDDFVIKRLRIRKRDQGIEKQISIPFYRLASGLGIEGSLSLRDIVIFVPMDQCDSCSQVVFGASSWVRVEDADIMISKFFNDFDSIAVLYHKAIDRVSIMGVKHKEDSTGSFKPFGYIVYRFVGRYHVINADAYRDRVFVSVLDRNGYVRDILVEDVDRGDAVRRAREAIKMLRKPGEELAKASI